MPLFRNGDEGLFHPWRGLDALSTNRSRRCTWVLGSNIGIAYGWIGVDSARRLARDGLNTIAGREDLLVIP